MRTEVTIAADNCGIGITASDDSLALWAEDEEGSRNNVFEGWDYFTDIFLPKYEEIWYDLEALRELFRAEGAEVTLHKTDIDDLKELFDSCYNYKPETNL